VTPSYAAFARAPYRALMTAALGATFLGSLDALMVTTALPTAAQDIGGVDLIALTVGATMVTVTMTLPFAGAVIDRYGAGRSFAIAVVLFTLANVVGGLASSMEVVAVSRAILGLGAGFMFAVPLGLFALYVPDELRPRAFGINAAMWGVSAVIGPALGAVLTDTIGWRWVFWVNLPLIAGVAIAGWIALRRHVARPPAAAQPLNVVGPVLLGLSVLALLTVPPIAVATAIAFVVHERRTRVPVFTHRPTSLAASVAAAASGAAFLGAETYLPLELQAGFGHGVGAVGVALVGATLGWTSGSMVAARFHAPPRSQITLGTALVFIGVAAMAIPVGGALVPIAAYAVSGVGMGIASPALFAAVLADGDEGREGQATSSVPVARQVGAGLGTAVAGIVFALALSEQAIRAAEREGARVPAVVDGARLTFVAAAALGLVGVVASRWLREGAAAEQLPPPREGVVEPV
jgi:MFS family permease